MIVLTSMPLLIRAKRAALSAARAAGLFERALDSHWRRCRVAILGYHGISVRDEHRCLPALFMTGDELERRLDTLRRLRCSVLPLDEAVRGLRAGNLPRRAVVLTFDDGGCDFYRRAWPVLRAFGFPATVYLSTYYCLFNKPVFPVACSYILWKSAGKMVSAKGLLPGGGVLDLRSGNRLAVWKALYAAGSGLGGAAQNDLLERLAQLLNFDWKAFTSERLLHVMNPAEVAEVAAAGIDVQLHTHRHRVPLDRDAFVREIEENRATISKLTGARPDHFCYPSGFHPPELLPWLAELGVRSAVTCDSGLAGPDSKVLLLPRITDHSAVLPVEFEGWLTGVRQFLPVRAPRPA